jgi:hypothetical protein
MRPRLRAGVFVSALVGVMLLTSGTAHAAPTATVTPSTGLQDLQSVAVSGSGFTTDVIQFGLAQCTGDGTPEGTVCIGHTVVAASGPGSFSTTFTVHQFVGTVDCAAAPGTCVIGASNIVGGGPSFSQAVIVPLTFGPGLPTSKNECKKGGAADFDLTKKECKDVVKSNG